MTGDGQSHIDDPFAELRGALRVAPTAGFESRVMREVGTAVPPVSLLRRVLWFTPVAPAAVAVLFVAVAASVSTDPPDVVGPLGPVPRLAALDVPDLREIAGSAEPPRVAIGDSELAVRLGGNAPSAAEDLFRMQVVTDQPAAVRRLWALNDLRRTSHGTVDTAAGEEPGPGSKLFVTEIELKPIVVTDVFGNVPAPGTAPVIRRFRGLVPGSTR